MPGTLARRAADGADLEDIHGAGREAVDGHAAAVGDEPRALPWAGCAAGTDGGKAHFKAAGVWNRCAAQDKLAAVAVEDVFDAGLIQRRA